MSERELLSAIGTLLDQKLDERFGTFEQKMTDKFVAFEQKMDKSLDEKLDKKLDEKLDKKLDEKLSPIYRELKSLNNRVKKLELLTENAILPRLQTIEVCYTDTFERYKRYCERMEKAFTDIDVLKATVENHSMKLQMIS